MVPPLQRQQAMQSPLAAHSLHGMLALAVLGLDAIASAVSTAARRNSFNFLISFLLF
jgi:hypothetical protein